MYLCRPSADERIGTLRPDAEEGAPAMPGRRSCSSCPAAAAARSGGYAAASSARRCSSRGEIGAVEIVLPTMPHHPQRIAEATAGWPVRPRIVVDQGRKVARRSELRARRSPHPGRSTLELAVAGVPTVAAYRGHAGRRIGRRADDQDRHRRARQSGARRKRRAGNSCSAIARPKASPRRSSAAHRTRRNGAAAAEAFAGSTTSWASAASLRATRGR